MEDLGWRIMEWAAPIVAAVVVWALGMLARWLAGRTRNEALLALIAQVQDAVGGAVRETQQTFVAALKEARSDGKLTDEEKKQALDAALATAKKVLGEKGLAALRSATGASAEEVDKLLKARIEAAVHDLRRPG